MKQIFNISLFALLAMVFVGCENGDAWGDNDGNSVDVEIPVGGYITFATDVQTRADLVTTNYIENSFGVISYMYDPTISWGSYKVNAEPTVGALGVALDVNFPHLTKVSYDDGSYTYGEPVAWESERYAFFAYAPYGNGKVVPSGPTVKGVPYVTYTLDTSDARNHADVITGYAANCSAAVSKNVTFKMNHRLAAVDVAAVNYYDYAYESGKDDGNNPIYTTEKVTIEIQSMTATFTNLQYGKAQISIDKSVPTVRTALAGKTAEYPIVGDPIDGGVYDLNPSANSDFNYISDVKNTTMLLIPQEYNPGELLTVEIEVKYKKRRPGDTYLWTVVETVSETNEHGETVQMEYKVDVPAGTDTSLINPNPDAEGVITVLGKETGDVFTTIQTASFDQALKEENRYYALLTFTSHAVSINILTAAAWDEKPVDYEFD